MRISPGGRRLRAVPDAEAGSHRRGRGQGRLHLRRRRGVQAGSRSSAPAPAPAPAARAGCAIRERRRNRHRARRRAASGHRIGGRAVSVSGGSDVYRIHPDGNPQKVWSHAQDIVYASRFDAKGQPLIGTGNKGYIYRIDSDDAVHGAAELPRPRRSRRFCAGPDGKLYAATGNVGKVYEIGPGLEREGSIESDVFDAGMFFACGDG